MEPEQRLLAQRARQFLVHSFLYYKLADAVISDERFDALAEELRTLRKQLPKAPLPHAELIDPVIGPESSGFAIRDYPVEIVTAAFRLLFAVKTPDGDFADFVEFVERRGYRLEVGRLEK